MQYLGRFKRVINETPLMEKTGLSGFRLGPPQTDLYSLRRQEASKFGFGKRDCTFCVVKRKALISCALLCSWSAPLFLRIYKNHDTAQIIKVDSKSASIWPDHSFVKTWVLTDLGGPRG